MDQCTQGSRDQHSFTPPRHRQKHSGATIKVFTGRMVLMKMLLILMPPPASRNANIPAVHIERRTCQALTGWEQQDADLYLLHTDFLLFVGLGSFCRQLDPLGLQLGDALLELGGVAEVLSADAVLQSLLGLHDVHLHLSQLNRKSVGVQSSPLNKLFVS